MVNVSPIGRNATYVDVHSLKHVQLTRHNSIKERNEFQEYDKVISLRTILPT
jgi:hypothetical protein